MNKTAFWIVAMVGSCVIGSALLIAGIAVHLSRRKHRRATIPKKGQHPDSGKQKVEPADPGLLEAADKPDERHEARDWFGQAHTDGVGSLAEGTRAESDSTECLEPSQGETSPTSAPPESISVSPPPSSVELDTRLLADEVSQGQLSRANGQLGKLSAKEPVRQPESTIVSESPPAPHEDTPIDVLGLSVRAYNCLRRAGFDTVMQTALLGDEQLLAIPNLSTGTLAEIRQKLSDFLANPPESSLSSSDKPLAQAVCDETALGSEASKRFEDRKEPSPALQASSLPGTEEISPPIPLEQDEMPKRHERRNRDTSSGDVAVRQVHPLAESQRKAVPEKPPTTLEEWERYLSTKVGQVELLGEIPVSDEERARLGKLLGLRLRGLGLRKAVAAIAQKYPCAFAVFLVAQGIYGYDGRRGYWPGAGEAIGRFLGANWSSELGRLFERILDALELPLFPDLGGRRFVDLILCHGGIPDYCMDDFFANMLQPAVTRAYYTGMSAQELIDEWLWHASSRYFTDKPVLRFLEFGGPVAKDFVQRCREMALEHVDSGIVPDTEEVGLPNRVVSAYRGWIAERGTDRVQREPAGRWRLRKPQVLIDPWGEGVVLDLPPQQVPATMSQADFSWQVAVAEETTIIPVRVRRTGFDRKTEAESIPLHRPADMYEVSLLVDGEVKRTWRHRGVDDEHPLLAFDPERFTLLAWQRSLPARRLGLLYPAKLDLKVKGEGRLEEEFPRLPWGWASFRGEVWDLSQATGLDLLENDRPSLSLILRPDESANRPHLLGGQLLFPETRTIRVPVYLGPPPDVRIPLRLRSGQAFTGPTNPDEQLARWRLTVRNKWPAVPERRTTVTLAELRSQMTITEKHANLPLSLPSLLGEIPFGNFVVRLRGPLGRDAEFTLRIIPHLVVYGHESLYLPDPQNGPRPVTFLVETLPGDRLEYQGGEGECRVQRIPQDQDHWKYEVGVGPDVTAVELTVVHPLTSGNPIRVPVQVPIHRLRWALMGEQMGSSRREWTGRIIKRSVDALLQIRAPVLVVRLPLRDVGPVHIGLGLSDVETTELQVADVASLPKGHQVWRFDLAAFLDTIRVSRSPVLRFELTIRNLPGQDVPLRLPILSLTKTLLVDNVELETRRVGDGAVFELRWREAPPLRNRQVRFWPLWRPWDPVVEQPIPDDAEGVWVIDVDPADFRSGKYRVEFLVVDPWAPLELPQRPPRDMPNTADVEMIAPDRQLKILNDRLQKRGSSFEVTLERAAVYHDIGAVEKAASDRHWCYEYIDDGTIPQALALVDLARDAGDDDLTRSLQVSLFAAHRVERLLAMRNAGKVSAGHFEAYMANLPRSGMLPVAACHQLLAVENEGVRLHAVQQLISQKQPMGPEAVVRWAENGQLSDADAIALLTVHAEYSAKILQENLTNAVALRLLKALGPALGDKTPIVQLGTWIYTDAGWGRIERIEDQDGASIHEFLSAQTEYRLHVTLRPAVNPEPILVDLKRKLLTFTDTDVIYTCTKCDGFSSRYRYLIVERHDRVTHGGIGPAYRLETTTIRSLRNLRYSARPPLDQGLGRPETL